MQTEMLRQMSVTELREVFRNGVSFNPSRLEDTEYVGVSLGLPSVVERLSWTTFMKVFHRDGDIVRGWNVRLRQTGIDGAVEPLLRSGVPHTFGHFLVRRSNTGERRSHSPSTVLLDYTAFLQSPALMLMRDPLVSLDGGLGDRLLGFSYVALGCTTVRTPSFFVLQRHRDMV